MIKEKKVRLRPVLVLGRTLWRLCGKSTAHLRVIAPLLMLLACLWVKTSHSDLCQPASNSWHFPIGGVYGWGDK